MMYFTDACSVYKTMRISSINVCFSIQHASMSRFFFSPFLSFFFLLILLIDSILFFFVVLLSTREKAKGFELANSVKIKRIPFFLILLTTPFCLTHSLFFFYCGEKLICYSNQSFTQSKTFFFL